MLNVVCKPTFQRAPHGRRRAECSYDLHGARRQRLRTEIVAVVLNTEIPRLTLVSGTKVVLSGLTSGFNQYNRRIRVPIRDGVQKAKFVFNFFSTMPFVSPPSSKVSFHSALCQDLSCATHMMFEAFGFMQGRPLQCRKLSQLPSGGLLRWPTRYL